MAIYSHCSENMAYAGYIFFWDVHQANLAFVIIPTSRKTKRKKVKTFFLAFLKVLIPALPIDKNHHCTFHM